MSYNHHLPKKLEFKVKKHHGLTGAVMIAGFLLPPLAVALRFGIGTDFFINVFCTICGYFPGHGHNFYVQNIRNNTNKKRTPKWALKAGLVDDSEQQRRKAKNAWSGRYEERNAHSTLEGQDYEEGQIADVLANPTDTSMAGGGGASRGREDRLWDENEVEFYNEAEAPNQRHHHYPMNFEGAGGSSRSRPSQYTFDNTVDEPKKSKKSSKKVSKKQVNYDNDDDVPAWGETYGAPRRNRAPSGSSPSLISNSSGGDHSRGNSTRPRDDLDHQF
ncbi:Proteolipid membrane potential modulator [Phaffia rhodozyma]|uniref:Proteolipid membrane potential modulator n=1 Tax=Phaffia rhodozyma TaxID=264483 RepID=A0A0F7SKK4_PHARH|nr:Proteolipid membrane potential modulator [Phaffia rhodozyma]